jgi:hypothetical protein
MLNHGNTLVPNELLGELKYVCIEYVVEFLQLNVYIISLRWA